nr:MAG TPA: hypothetical protein [Caudoviricetes sp.]
MRMHYEVREFATGKSQPMLGCSDAFSCKDMLKEMGFKWNSMKRQWEKAVSKDEVTTLFFQLAVACKMNEDDIANSWQFIPADIAEIEPSEEAAKAYADYIGYEI